MASDAKWHIEEAFNEHKFPSQSHQNFHSLAKDFSKAKAMTKDCDGNDGVRKS
jgi:hypothetical protein